MFVYPPGTLRTKVAFTGKKQENGAPFRTFSEVRVPGTALLHLIEVEPQEWQFCSNVVICLQPSRFIGGIYKSELKQTQWCVGTIKGRKIYVKNSEATISTAEYRACAGEL